MKLLSWMQSKLHGKFQNKGSHSSNPSIEQPEETNPSFPLGLLAIGTFGNNNNVLKVLKSTNAENAVVDTQSPSKETVVDDDDDCCSLEDVPKLEEELRELWQQNSQLGEEETDDFDNDQTEEQGVKKKIGLVTREWKGGNEKSNDAKSIVKRSASFLVKKIFVCGSGFAPLPPSNFMDTPQDATMKKILRMMLQKKIYPKNSSQMASLKRFIKEKERRDKRNEDEENKYDNCNGNSIM